MSEHKRNHRILLVNPPFHRLYEDTYSTYRYPLGLGYLAGTIKKATDWSVMVYNADFSPGCEISSSVNYDSGAGFKNYLRNLSDSSSAIWKEVKETIAEYRPTVVGIYCCAASFTSASIVAGFAKEFDKRTVVIVGGPHPTAIGRQTLAEQNIDVVVRGEGEGTIVELLKAIGEETALDKIEGIVYRSNGNIVETSERDRIEDLDSLSFPHVYAPEVLKDYDKYSKSAFRDVFVSRGCPYNCVFCGSRYIWSRKARFRSVANVTEEIRSLQKGMGLKWIEFGDDTFGTDKEYLRQLCDSLVRECPGILWGCLSRADLIDEETLTIMKKAGCRSIHIGIESGNNEMLRKIRKGITIEQALMAAELIRKYGIRLTTSFIIGFPEETEETMNDTFLAMKKIKGLIIYNIFTPYPGTEAFDLCKKAGLIDNDFDVTLYNHRSPENCFCMNIKKERFRELASEIEKYVDKHNARQGFENMFSFTYLSKTHDHGISRSLKWLARVIRSL